LFIGIENAKIICYNELSQKTGGKNNGRVQKIFSGLGMYPTNE
jgi:hypothetical protein